MKFGVIRFPGSCDEVDAQLACERVGEAVITIRGDVGRCAITTQNPETGEPDFDTLRTISTYRGLTENEAGQKHIPFGVYGEVAEPGRVAIGAEVEVVGLSLLDRTT